MLQKIKLKNVCQHQELEIDMGPGLTVVVGPQGSGKTNLFMMALSSVTGENPLPGKKDRNVRYGTGSKPSYISTQWRIAGKTYVVTRGLSNHKSSLIIDGELRDDLRREKEITDEVLSAFGCDKDTVLEFSYVKQSRTDDVLCTTPTDRVKFAVKLMGCQHILSWHTSVDKFCNQVDGILRVDYESDLRELLLRRNTLAADKITKQVELHKLLDQREILIKQAAGLEEMRKQHTEKVNIENKIKDLRIQYKNAADAKLENENKVQRLKVDIDSLRERVHLSEQCIEAVRHNDAVSKANNSLVELRNNLTQIDSNLIQPDKLPNNQKFDVTEFDELWESISYWKKKLQLKKENKSECDKCGAPIVLPEQSEEEISSLIKAIQDRLTKMKQQNEAVRSYELALELFKKNEPKYIEQRQSVLDGIHRLEVWLGAEGRLKELVTPNPLSEKEINEKRVELEKMNINLGSLIAVVLAKDEDMVRIRTSGEALAAKYNEIPDVGEEVLNKINEVDLLVQHNENAIRQYQTNLQILDSNISNNRESIRNTIEKYREHKRLIEVKQLVDSVLPHLKPTKLPQSVLSRLMGNIGSRMTELCKELGQPFTVYTSNDLEFQVKKPDGYIEQAQRLSQGQKACVSTVFWISRLLSNIKAGLPLLVLDEPSANMDITVVSQFGAMLEQLNKVLLSRNLQVILITHHQQLASCGQRVIQL